VEEVESAVESRVEEEKKNKNKNKRKRETLIRGGGNLISFSVAEHGAQRGPRFPRCARSTNKPSLT